MVYAFGDYELDPHRYTLSRAGQSLPLRPKVFRVLSYLLEQRQRVVSKQELCEQIWSERYVSDAAIESTIRAIRRTLGDSRQQQWCIKTYHGHGYRFAAAVTVLPEPSAAQPAPRSSRPLRRPAVSVPHQQEDRQQPAPPTAPSLQPPSGVRPEGSADERRQLTVLVCDLVESLQLAQQLDLDDYYEVLCAYQDTCSQVLQHFDGYMAQPPSHALLVYFGYPQTHDDAALRAVHAALGLLEGLRRLNERLTRKWSLRLTVRIGLHTGLVAMRKTSRGEQHGHLALGAVPQRATQIQQLAPPDTVVISAATMRLVQGYFVCQELRTSALAETGSSLHLWRVLRASGARQRLDTVTTGRLTPLAGRENEIGLLLERWTHVQASQGQAVIVRGDVGIGKSRLVRTLQERVAPTPHLCLEYHCTPSQQRTVLHPLMALWHRILAWQPQATSEEKLQRLETVLTQYHLPLHDTVPSLAPLLALPLPPGRYAPDTMPAPPQRVFEACVALLLAQTVAQPVLFIVEDVHWSDRVTLDFLTMLLDQVPTLPFYLLLTGRPALQSPWGQRSYLTHIALKPLSRPQTEQVMTWIAAGKRLPAEVVQHVAEKTGGLPLFVEELTKTLLESGLLHEAREHFELTASLPSLEVPMTLHDALMARLDRLGVAKELLQWGATIGRQFSYQLLRAVTRRDEATLQAELRTLVEAELLHQRGLAPHAMYRFAHPFIQDVASQTLLRRTQQHYHYHIAQALLRLDTLPTQAPVVDIARHLIEAGPLGDGDGVIEYARRAGDAAFGMFNWQQAIYFYTAALATAESKGRLDTSVRAELCYRTGLAWARDGNHDRSKTYYDEAIALYRSLGDVHGQAQVLMTQMLTTASSAYGTLANTQPLEDILETLGDHDPRLRSSIAIALSELYWGGRQTAKAEAMARHACALGQQLEDHTLCARARFNLALALLQNLHVHEAVEAYQEAYEEALLGHDDWLAGWPLQRLGTILFLAGRFDDVQVVAQEATEAATRTNNWGHHGLTLAALTMVGVVRGDFEAAERYGQETLMSVTRYRFPYGGVFALSALACAHAWRGNWQAAHAALDQLVEPGRVFPQPAPVFQGLVQTYRQLVQMYAGAGHQRRDKAPLSVDDVMLSRPCDVTSLPLYCARIELSVASSQPAIAARCYQILAPVVERGVLFSRGWVFLLPRLLGLAACLNHWWDAAEAHFQTAVATAIETGAQPELGRTYLDYAQMLLARGQERDRSRSLEMMQQARLLLEQLGMGPFYGQQRAS